MTTQKDNLQEDFKANLLDGDEIQAGQMLASTEIWEWVEERFTQALEEAEKKAINKGHWYIKSVQLDAYHNMAHYCKCGYKASQRGAVDGHIEWKKAELTELRQSERTE